MATGATICNTEKVKKNGLMARNTLVTMKRAIKQAKDSLVGVMALLIRVKSLIVNFKALAFIHGR